MFIRVGAVPGYNARDMLRVLAVDDSPAVRASLGSCLEPHGFEVEEAENGAAALRMIRARHYDLVFLDIHMPVLDGPSLLRILRAQGVTVPVVLVTSAAERGVVGAALKLGSEDYLSKPFTPASVKATLARALHLDPSAFALPAPRVLVLDPNGLVPAQLRALLPGHVRSDEALDLAGGMALARAGSYDALVVEPDVEDGDVRGALAALRDLQPAAGRFSAGPAPAEAAGDFDAVLPVPLEEEAVRRLLYESCLRPMAFAQGNTVRLAALRAGEPGVFFAVAARRLTKIASGLAATVVDLRIDLTRAPPEERVLTALVLEVRERLEELGLDPTFVVTAEARKALALSTEMARTAFVVSE